MLIAMTLTLVSEEDALLPRHLGRANYAEVLARLGQADRTLADEIHAGSGPKPLTCSGLLNGVSNRDGTAIKAGEPYFVRVTGLTQPVSEVLAGVLLEQTPEQWPLDGHPFAVVDVVCDGEKNPWSGRAIYEGLAAQMLLDAGRVARMVTLRFGSPTAFKLTQGMHLPVPLPGLVFGSLVERWNAFSQVTVSPEMRRFGEEMIAMSSYSLSSRPVVQKNGSLRIGGMGKVTYRAMGSDWYWLRVMQMLAEFAKFGGVGILTTAGMGQMRRG
ncbi:CRISPR system precrRNA processing endoribonuclease RAMP protein Cas6 [Chloroflexi bacterium TSY]|nr:CRISPR system precrRNA processing endoribonuclease RAMP protein Cas6 [Chloroflexi bacterium TSY]